MPKRILVVDDDPAILEVVQIVLQDEGFEVWTDDGQHLSDSINPSVDLILLDIWMHGVDGRAIAKQLKDSRYPVKVVLMSAHSDAVKSVRETGADGFIAKPFELDDMVEMVNEYVGEH